ncbi:MAG: 30S ribosomal protein S19 [archaeon]|nr:30S ribosomal protein S19 [archaeon]
MDDLAKKQVFKKFSYRGNDITKLIGMSMDDISKLLRSRQRRRLRRHLRKNYAKFMKKLMDAKKSCPAGEKPKAIKTHLRDCIVLPSMVQSIVSVYNGKVYNNVEIKPEMIGYYLGEFSMTYKKVGHGRPGVGATHSSKFVPIK